MGIFGSQTTGERAETVLGPSLHEAAAKTAHAIAPDDPRVEAAMATADSLREAAVDAIAAYLTAAARAIVVADSVTNHHIENAEY